MISTLAGACLVAIATSVAVWLQIAYGRRDRSVRELPVEDLNRRLTEIDAELREGKLTASEADAARIALIWEMRGSVQRPAFITSILSARRSTRVAILGLVLAALAASTYLTGDDLTTGAAQKDVDSGALAGEDSDAAALALLKTYTRTLDNAPSPPMSRPDNLLPDVDTMIDQLATRLKSNPRDIAGWRTLGWSYFHTGHYDQSIAAYAHAVELDPGNVELKTAYEDAKAKVNSGRTGSVANVANAVGTDVAEVSSAKIKQMGEMPPAEREAAIRSMVESLASRLEASPVDVDGWTRLIRSRVVLSEKEKAATALRKALDIFKDDAASREKVAALAKELGLSTN